jgi:hypothetical protein
MGEAAFIINVVTNVGSTLCTSAAFPEPLTKRSVVDLRQHRSITLAAKWNVSYIDCNIRSNTRENRSAGLKYTSVPAGSPQ